MIASRRRWHRWVPWFLSAGMLVVTLTATSSVLRGAALRRPHPVVDTIGMLDPIARLQRRLDRGEVTLPFDSAFGYLPGLLRLLDIPVASQGLVFSRTSLQTDRIAPWAPRALYFNDDVYVGFVQGSPILEIAAVHPTSGGVFYTLSQEPRPRPVFSREKTTCLMCHQSRAATGGVPGFMVLSTLTDRLGYPITGAHDGPTTDATPLHDRFAGWYVTGRHGTVGHAGNRLAKGLGHEVTDKAEYRERTLRGDGVTRTSMAGVFDTVPYLSGQSDMVALMVLVHQTAMHNQMALVHEAAAEALREIVWRDTVVTPTVLAGNARLRGAVDRLFATLTFADAAPLAGPLRGTTDFAVQFPSVGAHDAAGRSLRDLELEHRLFRYPVSFLITSDAFRALPEVIRRGLYQRLDAGLRGEVPEAGFRALSAAERTETLALLRATVPDFARVTVADGLASARARGAR